MKATTGLLLLAATALAGCYAGDGTSPPPNPGGGDGVLQSNFQSIQDAVFTPLCTVCHIGASAPVGLRLDGANSFGLLVGVTSAQAPPLLRVNPGNPDDSYLIQKLEGTAQTGQLMPIGTPALPQADIDVIRQWILDGALPTMSPPSGEPIRVTLLSPLPGSTLHALPASIIAMFDRDLEATSVDATTFTLERSGGDGTFGDGNEVMVTAAAITVTMANPMTAIFDLTGVASLDDSYRVRIAGSGGATIRDLDASALDGEFNGFFPSGDGTQGGDFEGFFTVAALAPTIESIQANVFSTTCSSGCHTGPTGGTLPRGMDLSNTDASFNSLVLVPSIQNPAIMRVIPGDPDASYLVQKIEGRAGFGQIMPPPAGGAPLDQALIDIIRRWIANGANR